MPNSLLLICKSSQLALQCLVGLFLLMLSEPPVSAAEPQQPKSIFQAAELNHLSLDIMYTDRSEAFYRSVFGFTPVSHGRGGGDKFMHFQEGFLNMRPSAEGRLNHFCFSIKGFDPNAVFQLLALTEAEPFRMGGQNLHCYDPDRLNVQVQEERHGWGRINGDQLTDAEMGIFKTVRIDHIALNVTDVSKSRDFYQQVFGLSEVDEDVPGNPCVLKVGKFARLELHQAEEAGLNHVCFAVQHFDGARLAKQLKPWTSGAVTQPQPGVYRFEDPQGISVEICPVERSKD